jgi:hypothetical protein
MNADKGTMKTEEKNFGRDYRMQRIRRVEDTAF